MTYQPVNSKTAFLPTNEVFPKDEGQRLIKLTSNYTDISQAVNVREISIYQNQQPVITGQQFSDVGTNQVKKYTFRNMFYFAAIASGATLTIAHHITGLVQCTDIHGTCVTDVVDYRPIPYSSATLVTDQISVLVTATDVVITNGATAPDITSGIIILEYLLN